MVADSSRNEITFHHYFDALRKRLDEITSRFDQFSDLELAIISVSVVDGVAGLIISLLNEQNELLGFVANNKSEDDLCGKINFLTHNKKISKNLKKNLHFIRRCRNKFAHDFTAENFDQEIFDEDFDKKVNLNFILKNHGISRNVIKLDEIEYEASGYKYLICDRDYRIIWGIRSFKLSSSERRNIFCERVCAALFFLGSIYVNDLMDRFGIQNL